MRLIFCYYTRVDILCPVIRLNIWWEQTTEDVSRAIKIVSDLNIISITFGLYVSLLVIPVGVIIRLNFRLFQRRMHLQVNCIARGFKLFRFIRWNVAFFRISYIFIMKQLMVL